MASFVRRPIMCVMLAQSGAALPWTTFGASPQHTFSTTLFGPTPQAGQNVTTVWSKQTYTPCPTTVWGSSGSVYQCILGVNGPAIMWGLDGSTGSQLWAAQNPVIGLRAATLLPASSLSNADASSHGQDPGSVSNDGQADGILVSPAGSDLMGTGVMALNASNGNTVWSVSGRYNTMNALSSSLDGIVVYGSDFAYGSGVYALDSSTGDQLWNFDASGTEQFYASPTVSADGSLIFATAMSGMLYALDPSSGSPRWNVSLGQSYSAVWTASVSGAANGTVLYIGAVDGLRALSIADGTRLWTCATGPVSLGGVAVPHPSTGLALVFVNADDGYAYACNTATGAVAWRAPCASSGYALSVDGAGTVYCGAGTGNLTALDGATGRPLWSWTCPGGSISSPPVIGPNGTLFVLSVGAWAMYGVGVPSPSMVG